MVRCLLQLVRKKKPKVILIKNLMIVFIFYGKLISQILSQDKIKMD